MSGAYIIITASWHSPYSDPSPTQHCHSNSNQEPFYATKNVSLSFAPNHLALSVLRLDKIEEEKNLNRNDGGKTSERAGRYRAHFIVMISGLAVSMEITGYSSACRHPPGHSGSDKFNSTTNVLCLWFCGMYNLISITHCSKFKDSCMENGQWRLIRIICGTDPTFTFHTQLSSGQPPCRMWTLSLSSELSLRRDSS